jgi:hypothetical protein
LITTTPTLDLGAVKSRQHTTWASGDYVEIATLIVPAAERLADAADLRAGWTVFDVASESGDAALAAARLRGVVTGIDCVPALLESDRGCAEARLRGDLERDLRNQARSWNRLERGSPIAVPSAYVESIGPRGVTR